MGGSEITKIELMYIGKHWQIRKYLPIREDEVIFTLICTIYAGVKIIKIGTNISFCHFCR